MRLHFLPPSIGHYIFPFYHGFENSVSTWGFIFLFVHAKNDSNNSSCTFATLEYKMYMQPKIDVESTYSWTLLFIIINITMNNISFIFFY